MFLHFIDLIDVSENFETIAIKIQLYNERSLQPHNIETIETPLLSKQKKSGISAWE